MKYLRVNLLAFFLCCWSVSQAQFQIPNKPKEQTSVYDYINLLSKEQKKTLEQKLIRYSDSTSTQIVIAIIPSTEGENINYLGAQWGEKWGIGQAEKDNGILILLARNDRRIAINTGDGVEGNLPDALSRRIIENVIIPQFKQDNYYGGLNDGADAIFQVLNGEFEEERTFDTDSGLPFSTFLPFIIFFIIIIILSNRRKGGGSGGKRSSGLDLWDIIILSNMGRSGGSSGGFGSGGGSFGGGGGFSGGFGGGGFSGGGASGGW